MKLSALMLALDHALYCSVLLNSTDQAASDKTIGSAAVTLHLHPPGTPGHQNEPSLSRPPRPLLLSAVQMRHHDAAWLATHGWTACGASADRHLWHRSHPGVLIRLHPVVSAQGPAEQPPAGARTTLTLRVDRPPVPPKTTLPRKTRR